MPKIVTVACGLVLLASCTAPAPAASSRERDASETGDDDDDDTTPPRKKDAGAAEDHSQHAAEKTVDDGSKPSTGTDVFSGAPAYTSGSAVHKANDHHETSMTGKDCFSCHGDHAPALKFAGTVYRGTQPAGNVQVRVLDADGKVQGSAFSDADGNFWVAGAALTPGRTGLRNATTKKSMVASVTTGSCNASSCHGENNRLTVP